jgi:putative SbcD/Mre11-related phosphoesterase
MPDATVPAAVADLDLRDRAVRLGDALVLADLHLGQGATSGLDFPVGDGARTVERVEALLAWAEPDRLVLAGDLLHSFRTVPQTVTEALAAVQDAAADHGARPVALAGNHDAMLASVWEGPVRETQRVGDTVVCHGHETPAADADRYVLGHEHPVLSVAGRRRPCYLAGEAVYEGADVVVLPAFSRLLRGVEVGGLGVGEFMSPLVDDADAFAPIVWDADAGEALPFPRLGQFREQL